MLCKTVQEHRYKENRILQPFDLFKTIGLELVQELLETNAQEVNWGYLQAYRDTDGEHVGCGLRFVYGKLGFTSYVKSIDKDK
jgi:hypothetical protein